MTGQEFEHASLALDLVRELTGTTRNDLPPDTWDLVEDSALRLMHVPPEDLRYLIGALKTLKAVGHDHR